MRVFLLQWMAAAAAVMKQEYSSKAVTLSSAAAARWCWRQDLIIGKEMESVFRRDFSPFVHFFFFWSPSKTK